MVNCFKKEIAAIVILFFCFATVVVAQQPAAKNQPNIIFILADDLGYADIGCYGQQKIETPNIDKLAKKGMKFTQFYSASTVCAPGTGLSFLTGLHTGHTPVIRGNKPFAPEGQTPLPDICNNICKFVTTKEVMQQLHLVNGDWVLITTVATLIKKALIIFYGYNCQSLAHDYYRRSFMEQS